MKHILLTFILLAFFITEPASAGQDEYDDCVLEHLKGAKLDLAAHLIIQACNDNYKRPNYTPKKKLAYNQCLLEHLVGIESIQAAMEIRAACERKTD